MDNNLNEIEVQNVPTETVSISAGNDLEEKSPKVRLEVTSEMKNNLYEATKFFRFVNIVDFVLCVLSAILGIIAFIAGLASQDSKLLIQGLSYLLSAAIVGYGVRIVFCFNAEARWACEENDSEALNKMFKTLLRGAKYVGFLTALWLFVIVCIFVFVFGFGLIAVMS